MGREKHFWTVHANLFVHMCFVCSLRSGMIVDGSIEVAEMAQSHVRPICYCPCARWRILRLIMTLSVPYPSLDALSRVNEHTGEDSPWDSSLLTHRRHSSGRRDCSIRRARQSACSRSRQHPGLITSSSDAWLTCCWHFASLKLFFWMHASMCQLRSSLKVLVCLTLDGTRSRVAWRIAFDVLF